MSEKSWWDLWNTSYRTQDDNDYVSSELFERAASLINAITKQKESRMLEVACGTGTLSRKISYATYHGLDISPAAIEIARQKSDLHPLAAGAGSRTYEAADFHDWPLPSEPFDMVLCVDAISCFRDQALVLRKMAQSLRAGGSVVLTSVNPVVYNRIRRAGGVRLENGPVSHWLSRRELHDLVHQAGLTLEHSYTIMPRGNMGILRLINARRLNQALGQRGAALFRRLKERVGLGQYRVVIARKVEVRS